MDKHSGWLETLRLASLFIGVVLAGTVCLQAASQQPSSGDASPASPYRALLNRYCVTCHNEKLKTANLLLDKMDVDDKIADGAAVWEKVVRKLRTGAMPPVGVPRPDKAAAEAFAAYIETTLDRAAAAHPIPGRPAVHRLNRAEYSNAVRDLLAVEIDTASLLPADDAGHGFDNIADVLSVSPLRIEKYISAAAKISRIAVGDPATRPAVESYKVSDYLVLGPGVIGIDRQGVPQQTLGFLEIAALGVEQAQHLQGGKLRLVENKHLFVKRFRLSKISGLMGRHCLAKHLQAVGAALPGTGRNRCFCHAGSGAQLIANGAALRKLAMRRLRR